jgi:DNA modification methylase
LKGDDMAPRILSIDYLPISSLRLDPQNPRLHNTKQIRQLANSIGTFGFNVPVLVDAQLRVIAGHGRVLACKLLEIAQIPVIRLEHLSESQVRAFMIADNRLTENSEWENRLLGEQFKILSEAEIDFSLEVTGFEMSEIDMFVEGLPPASRVKDDTADAILDSGTKPQVTRVGHLWVLGRHRVHCGDARNDSAYVPLMNGRPAEMVFADPPYNDPIGCVTRFRKIHYPEFAVASGRVSESKFTEFLTSALGQLARNSVDGALHFICMDWRHSGELIAAAGSVYAELKDLCVWVKDTARRGSLYRSKHEFVFVFMSGKKPHRNNMQIGQFGRDRTNVWQYRRANSLSRKTEKGHLSLLRPTIKPVKLVADAIRDCTTRGDMVLDPFLGSGTTVIAAERTGRACYGIELEPRYVDAIVRRWQALTGQNAIQESTGRNFNEMEEENHGRGNSAGAT